MNRRIEIAYKKNNNRLLMSSLNITDKTRKKEYGKDKDTIKRLQ